MCIYIYIYMRNSCGSFAENFAEICGDCNFPLYDDQQTSRRFAKTTNPRKQLRRNISRSWLVKFPI